jgi:hypothetical protein
MTEIIGYWLCDVIPLGIVTVRDLQSGSAINAQSADYVLPVNIAERSAIGTTCHSLE